jgi:alcohol dehydrogenase class IV
VTGFFTAPRIATGPGAIEQLSALGAQRAAIVVDPLLHRADRHQRLVEELAKTDTSVEVIPSDGAEPTIVSAEALTLRLRSFHPEWIIALGGGRTIDSAKAAWIRYACPESPLESITPLVELRLRSSAGFVAVPTTSGSGCEASWTATVRGDGGRPVELASRELVPDWALLDPALPASMAPELTAETGAEFVAHAFEAVVSEWSNPLSDAFARDAIATAFTELPKAVKHPDDLDARLALHCAATMAGIAASNSQFGAARALAVALATEGGPSYGRLLGTLLPYVAEFNYPSARDKYASLAGVFGASAVRDRSGVAERLRILWSQVGIPKTLSEAGVARIDDRESLAAVVRCARASTSAVANPRVPSEEEFARLLESAFAGSPVTF